MDVWAATLAATASEPVWIQIALVLGAAFAAVMCLEGIRASLFPCRYAANLTNRYAPDAKPGRLAALSAGGPPQPDRVKYGAMPRPVVKTCKRALPAINHHSPLKPRIQRILAKTPPDTAPRA
jgi:hypothetical protein